MSGDLSLPNGGDFGSIPPAPKRDQRARLVIVSVVDDAAEALELLQALGLAPPPKGPPRDPGIRVRNWLPGSYEWRLVPRGKVLHAVKDGLVAAACGSRPRAGRWLPLDEGVNGRRCCSSCQLALIPETADAVALPPPRRAVAVRGGPRPPRRGADRLRRRGGRALGLRAPRRA